MQRASREVTSNGQGTKKTNKAVIVHSSSSSSSTSAVQGFTTATNSGYDFQIFSRGAVESIKIGKGIATWVYTKSQSVHWEVLNFSPIAQLILNSDTSCKGWEGKWGASHQGQTTRGPYFQEERKSNINVLEIKAPKLTIMHFTAIKSKGIFTHVRMDNMEALPYQMKVG